MADIMYVMKLLASHGINSAVLLPSNNNLLLLSLNVVFAGLDGIAMMENLDYSLKYKAVQWLNVNQITIIQEQ